MKIISIQQIDDTTHEIESDTQEKTRIQLEKGEVINYIRLPYLEFDNFEEAVEWCKTHTM